MRQQTKDRRRGGLSLTQKPHAHGDPQRSITCGGTTTSAPRRSTPRASAPASPTQLQSREANPRAALGGTVTHQSESDPLGPAPLIRSSVCCEKFPFSGSSAAFGRRRYSPGRSGPRSAAGGRPGGGARQGPDDRGGNSSGHRALCGLVMLLWCVRAAFSAADPGHGRSPPVKALTVPAGSRCA
jgi:hypothetical protein